MSVEQTPSTNKTSKQLNHAATAVQLELIAKNVTTEKPDASKGLYVFDKNGRKITL